MLKKSLRLLESKAH